MTHLLAFLRAIVSAPPPAQQQEEEREEGELPLPEPEPVRYWTNFLWEHPFETVYLSLLTLGLLYILAHFGALMARLGNLNQP